MVASPMVSVMVGRGLYDVYKRNNDGSWTKAAAGLGAAAASGVADAVIEELPSQEQLEVALDKVIEALPTATELGEVVGAATAAAISATTNFSGAVIREIGPALVDSAELAYDAIAKKIAGQEANAIAGITVAVLTIVTVIFLFNEISRGPTP
tara:strand:+ start:925 stop:1383 length:459 start_codon:yes stop_codon:yes gene_type:complete